MINGSLKIEDVDPGTTSQGYLIEDIRADNNTFTGMSIADTTSIITPIIDI